jgi:hypothetical protein
MALIDKQVDPKQLSKEEIQFLMELIKRSTFQGESLEGLYNLVLKLQSQFVHLGDK